MNQQRQLAKNTMILAIGKSVGSLASLLLLPVYTMFLSPNDYGLVDLIITYIALFVPLATLQVEMALFRYLVDVRSDEEGKSKIVSNALQTVLITTAILVGPYVVLATVLHLPYMWLIMLNIITTIFSNLFMQIARGFGDNKRFAKANIVAGIVLLVVSVVLVIYAHMGIAGILLASTSAGLAAGMYLFITLNINKYVSFTQNSTALKKELLGYSLPLIPNSVSWWVINVSDRTIVTVFLGLAANGIYAVSNKFAAIFIGIFGVFGMSWTESASVHINAKNRDAFFSDVANVAVRGFGSLGVLMLAALPIIFPIMIGSQFKDALNYIPFLILAALFNAVVGIYSGIYVAKKLTRQVMNTSFASAAINIVLNLILIKFIGIYAVALSTAVAYLVMAIYRHYDVKKYVTISYEDGLFVKMAAIYIVTITLYYYNQPVANIMNIVFAIIVAIRLNKSIINIIKNKIMHLGSRQSPKLTP